VNDAEYIKRLEAENTYLKQEANNWRENDKRRWALTFIICNFYTYKFRIETDINGRSANVIENLRRNFKAELLNAKGVTKDIVDIMVKKDKNYFEDLVNEIIGYD
jgi:hypothetical protein